MSTRIALIHATPLAMQPVIAAFDRGWREVTTMNLLDDALSADLARAGYLDADMKQRIATLATYAAGTGVAGILFTCSAFGEAIEAVAGQSSMPVLKPNEAMFEEALCVGHTIGLLATFQPAIPSLEQEFMAMAEAQGKSTKLESVWVPDAMEALTAGDADRHDRLIAEAATALGHCNAIMLGQFSMARARAAVEKAVSTPILTSPDSAVAKLRRALA